MYKTIRIKGKSHARLTCAHTESVNFKEEERKRKMKEGRIGFKEGS